MLLLTSIVISLILPSVLAGVRLSPDAPAQPPKMNVILIMADDSSWADLGANWPPTLDSPFLTELAARSLRLTDYHSGASVCSPSRASLLTGRIGQRTGVTDNFPLLALGGLPANETTLGEFMKSVGYATAIHGKWHLGHRAPHHPSYRGFDEYYGVPYSVDMGCLDVPGHNVPPDHSCPNVSPPMFNISSLGLPLYHSSSPQCDGRDCNLDIISQPLDLSELTDHYIDADISFVTRMTAQKKPFFLYIPLSHLHVPLATAPRFVNTSRANTVFGDTLLELDTHLRTFYETLERLDILNNTLLIYTSDNGPWKVKCELAGSQGPFLGTYQTTVGGGGSTGKLTTWEAGHRVPLLVHWRGRIEPRVSNALASHVDWVPTLSALTGFKLPSDREFDGIDLSPILFEGSDRGHETLFHPDPIGNLTAMRYGRYKAYFRTYSVPACGGILGRDIQHNPPLIFDLSKDLAESTPVTLSKSDMDLILNAHREKVNNIRSTPRSHPNYRAGTNADAACCNATHVACRC